MLYKLYISNLLGLASFHLSKFSRESSELLYIYIVIVIKIYSIFFMKTFNNHKFYTNVTTLILLSTALIFKLRHEEMR